MKSNYDSFPIHSFHSFLLWLWAWSWRPTPGAISCSSRIELWFHCPPSLSWRLTSSQQLRSKGVKVFSKKRQQQTKSKLKSNLDLIDWCLKRFRVLERENDQATTWTGFTKGKLFLRNRAKPSILSCLLYMSSTISPRDLNLKAHSNEEKLLVHNS